MDTTLQGNSIDRSCRCCGNNFETNLLSSLFEYSNVVEMEIYRIVLSITAISIYKNDGEVNDLKTQSSLTLNNLSFLGFSQVICAECVDQAIKSYKFQQMCVNNDDCLRMSRKPLLNNEHDYSLYMTDDYDMDLSEYLMVGAEHEATVEDLPKVEHGIKSIIQIVKNDGDRDHDESSSEPTAPEDQPVPTIDETQNYDFTSLPKKSHRYTCPVCLKLWPTPSKLKRHLKIHTTSKDFRLKKDPEPSNDLKPIVQCPICFVALSSQNKLTDHMKRHKTEKNSANEENETINVSFVCSVCEDEFNTPKKLRNHVNTQHIRKFSIVASENEESICPEKMKSKTTQVDRSCGVCGKSFDCPSKLQRHLPVHQKFRPPPKRKPLPKRHPCQKCDKKFETPSKLQRHEGIHSKFKPIDDSLNSKISEIMKS